MTRSCLSTAVDQVMPDRHPIRAFLSTLLAREEIEDVVLGCACQTGEDSRNSLTMPRCSTLPAR